MSNSPIVAVDKDHRELHRIGGAAVRLFELRPAVGPDAPDLVRQFRREVHLLRDDRVPIAGFTEALAQLRPHLHAISTGRPVERADPAQTPVTDIAPTGLVGGTGHLAYYSPPCFLRLA